MRAFIYYGLSGATNTTLTYLLYISLVMLIDYRLAIPLTYGFGICLAYWLQGRVVFQRYGPIHRFLLVYLLLFALNFALTWLLVERVGWRPELAQLPAVALCFIVGFFLSKGFVFRGAHGSAVR